MNQARTLGRPRTVRNSIVLLFSLGGAVLAILLCVSVMVAAANGTDPFPWAAQEEALPSEAAKQALPPAVAPPSDPAALRPISPNDALAANAAIPLSTGPNPAATGFATGGKDVGNWARSIDCLTAAVYYEAASEGAEGMRAVAQVVLNRVRHPAYPHSVCGVVFQGSERKTGCQFSFTCDGALARAPSRSGWALAQAVAGAALGGFVYRPVGWSTHYHTDWVVPYWASSLVKTAVVGSHIFYRWTGGWGQPRAFSARYAGVEPALDWRAGASDAEAAAAAEIPVAAAPLTASGGQALPSMAERPVLATATSGAGSAPAQAEAPRAYVLANRRWVLGGVAESEAKPAKPAGDVAGAAGAGMTRQ